jgi:hypothetical protein
MTAPAKRRSRYPRPRRVAPGKARYLSELPDALAAALVRCYTLDVPVEKGPRVRGVHIATLRAGERHGLLHVAHGLVTSKGRKLEPLWKPTIRGLELVHADEPRLLASRSQHGYVTPAGDDLRVERVEVGAGESRRVSTVGELEAVDAVSQARFVVRANATDAARRAGADERLFDDRRAIEARLAEYRRLAVERGVDVRSDLRLVEKRLDAVEAKLRRQSQGRAA